MNWNEILHSEPIDVDPRPDFEAQLRDDLVGAWNGRPITTPTSSETSPDHPSSRSPRRSWLLAAAAAAVVVIGGVVVATRPDGGQTVQTSATEPTPGPTTIPSTGPVTDPSSPTEPAPTAPATTASVPPTTAPSTTGPPTTVPRTTVPTPVLLTDWPAPSGEAGDLAAVPRLLPAEIDGVTEIFRNEAASPPVDTYDYTQSWVAADGSAYLEIVTNLDQLDFTPIDSRTSADVGGWDEAYFTRSVPRYANLRLVADGGTVWVSSFGLGEERVIDIARSLSRRPAGEPGWEIDDAGLVEFGEGGDVARASRSLRFQGGDTLLAELWISTHLFNGPSLNWFPESTVELIDIDGRSAVAADNGFATAVSWTLDDGTAVQFGYRGGIDEAIALARTIAPANQATWEAQTVQDPGFGDGCNSLFC